MSLIPRFTRVPQNIAEWDRWLRSLVVTPGDGTVTPDSMSLADTNGKFLVRRGSTMTYDTLADGDIPSAIARDSEVTTAVSTAISNHEAATDPHPTYTTAAELAAGITAHEAALDPHPGYLTQSEADALYVALADVLDGSKTFDPTNLADGAGESTTVTVTGAALGDFALASFSLSTQGIILCASVTAADTVTVRFQNETGGAIDLASGTLRVRVWKQ